MITNYNTNLEAELQMLTVKFGQVFMNYSVKVRAENDDVAGVVIE